jgi:tRNA (cmo5U34)-methyltransferase
MPNPAIENQSPRSILCAGERWPPIAVLFMSTPLDRKSTIEEIRTRFDADVERFSNLETGQQATIDAPLVLELVAQTCKGRLESGATLVDIGCGAGNYTVRVLQEVTGLHCHLVDLSRPMLDRAERRVREAGAGSILTHQSDFRALSFPENSFDCILAGAVLHHLRGDEDWTSAFARLHSWLKPGGRLYVADLMTFDLADTQEVMWERYGAYLKAIGGDPCRDKVFAYIDHEDSPRSLPFQLDLLKATGFSHYDVLHRNSVFACYFGQKGT